MKKRFDVLDSFRGIAAVFIIIHNIRFTDSVTELTFFLDGRIFVEMFFVLSGFVLTHGYAFKPISFKSFFISRTFRIFPLHLFMLLLVLASEIIKYLAYQYGVPFNNAPLAGDESLSFLVYHLFLVQSWLPFVPSTGFNNPSWSISIEYYMYMIFFVTLLFNKINKAYLWVLISLIRFIFLLNNFGVYEVIRGLSSFFLGSLMYLLYKKLYYICINISKNYFSLIEAFILLSIIYILSSDMEYKSIIATIAFALQMFVFAFEKGIISIFLKKSFFLHIGKLSYSMYLLHYFILSIIMFVSILFTKIGFKFTDMIDGARFINFGNGIINNIVLVLIISIVIFLSKYTYKHIELKWQNIGKKLI